MHPCPHTRRGSEGGRMSPSHQAPRLVVERRDENLRNLVPPVVHAFLVFQVVHVFRVNGCLLHEFRGIRRHWRLVPVAVHAVFCVGFINVAAVHAGATTVVLVPLNFLQFAPRVLLRGKQRHLVIGPAVRAPLGALVVGFLHLGVGREACAVRVADGFCVVVVVVVARDVEHLFLHFNHGHPVAAAGLLDRDVDFRVF